MSGSRVPESWKVVPGSESYTVSSLGRVRGVRGRILKPHFAGSRVKYLYVSLVGRRHVAVHVLVCEAFHGRKPSPAHMVAHWNGNPLDNREENLRWVTAKENVADQIRHGTLHPPVFHGEQHPAAKLTSAIVASLRGRRFAYGEAMALAERYGVSRRTIHDAASGVTWQSSTEPRP